MISLASDRDKAAVRQMWAICFEDSEAFMALYFSEKYSAENTLLFFEGEKAVASLQMLPYLFRFYGTEIPVAYISGACTLPEYRNRGYMSKLILRAFEIMRERAIPISILIPAEEWLYNYYSKLGYEKVFEKDNQPIELQKIVEKANGSLDLAYELFETRFRTKDFCVQKTEADFVTIVKSAEMDDFPKQTNLSGMARVIDAERLLSLYAQDKPEESFHFLLEDQLLPHNSAFYRLAAGTLERQEFDGADMQLDINGFTRFIFGFSFESLPFELKPYFYSHKAVLNLMLE